MTVSYIFSEKQKKQKKTPRTPPYAHVEVKGDSWKALTKEQLHASQ